MQPGDAHGAWPNPHLPKIPDDVTHLIAQFSSFEVLASLVQCNKSLHRSYTALLFREIRLHKPTQLVKLCRNREALSRLGETKSIFLEERLFHTHLWADLVEQSAEASTYLIMALRAATSLLRLQIFDSPTTGIIWTYIIKHLCALSSDPTFLPKLEVLVGNRFVSLESLQENRPIKFLYFHEDLDMIMILVGTYPSSKGFGASLTTNPRLLEQEDDLSPTEIGSLVYESKGTHLPERLHFHFTIRFPEAIKTKEPAPIPDLLVWLQEMIRAARLSSDDISSLIFAFHPSPSYLSSSTEYLVITGLSELLPQLKRVQISSPFLTWHKHKTSHDSLQDSLPSWTPEPSRWSIDWWFDTLRLGFEGTKTQEEAEHIAGQLKEGMHRRYGLAKIPPMEILVSYVLSLNA